MIVVIQLVVDWCIVLLVSIVQFILYPGFMYFTKNDEFQRWHKFYMNRITLFVGPLMLSQLMLAWAKLVNEPHWLSIFYLVVVLCAWLVTVLYAVPLHQRLSEQLIYSNVNRLLRVNSIRLVAWVLAALVTTGLRLGDWFVK